MDRRNSRQSAGSPAAGDTTGARAQPTHQKKPVAHGMQAHATLSPRADAVSLIISRIPLAIHISFCLLQYSLSAPLQLQQQLSLLERQHNGRHTTPALAVPPLTGSATPI